MAAKYTPPTVDDIRDFLDRNGLSQGDAAKLVKIDPRTFRWYVSATKPRPIPYAVWFTLTTRQRVRLLDAEKRGHMQPIE